MLTHYTIGSMVISSLDLLVTQVKLYLETTGRQMSSVNVHFDRLAGIHIIRWNTSWQYGRHAHLGLNSQGLFYIDLFLYLFISKETCPWSSESTTKSLLHISSMINIIMTTSRLVYMTEWLKTWEYADKNLSCQSLIQQKGERFNFHARKTPAKMLHMSCNYHKWLMNSWKITL